MPQTVVRTVTLSLTADAMDAGDVLAATQEVPNAVKEIDLGGMLESLVVIDADDVKGEMDVFLLSANVSMGAEDAVPGITDANAVHVLGHINVPAANFEDLGGVGVATVRNIGLPIIPAAGTTSMYVAVITPGTPTHTAAGVTLRFGITQG
jgi:hypothetical protein